MAAMTQRVYEAMLTCVAKLHDCNDLEQFPRVALTEIPKLVGADHATFNYVAPLVPKVVVLGVPDLTGNHHADRERVFARYLGDQPVLKNYLATGDGGAYKLSDFLSVREYHALPLYKHLYHDLRYEDQMAFMLFPPGAELISIALARDRRTFHERDREILNLLRPHVAQAYRRAEKLTLLSRQQRQSRPEPLDVRITSILLDARNRPIQFGPEAQQWLGCFFPGRARHPFDLPETVAAWLRDGRRAPKREQPRNWTDNLVREREDRRLRLQVIPGMAGGAGRILVLELETIAEAAHSKLASRLSRREIEVLLQVEQGKTNEETAAALGISPLTVRTHLEHIFGKLKVPSRTAAVTRFRGMASY